MDPDKPRFEFAEPTELFDRTRFDDESVATVLTAVHAPLNFWKESYELLYRGLQTIELDRPVWVALCRGSIVWPVTKTTPSSSMTEAGQMNLVAKSHVVHLLDANFLLLSTTLSDSTVQPNYEHSKRRLNVAASSIGLHFGTNFAPDPAIHITIGIKAGTVTDVPQSRALPNVIDGPYLDPSKWDDMHEVFVALQNLDDATRRRVERALTIFGTALSSDEGYIYYWVALETLCGTDKIKARIQKCYKLSDTKAADEKFRISAAKDLRNSLVHQGDPYEVSTDVERYVQVIFLDLIRFETGLSHRGYMEKLINTPQINLTQIGINH